MNNDPNSYLGITIAVLGTFCFILMVVAGILHDLGLDQEGEQ